MNRLLLAFVAITGMSTCYYSDASSQVTREWISHFDGKGNVDETAYAMTTDPSGNIFITGAMPATGGTSTDVITLKLNKFGTIVWRNRYTAKYGASYGKAIAVDGAGNVYAAGYVRGASNSDFLLIKYTSAGDTLWTRQRNGPENGYDDVAGLVINASGNIFVAGQSAAGTTDNIMTAVYDADGNELALLSYTVNSSSHEKVNSISADATGNVYITGYTNTTSLLSTQDALTLKYSALGTLVWAKTYNSSSNNYDVGNQVVVDLSGNVFVTGTTSKTNGSYDVVTVKYNSAGDTLWTRSYDGGYDDRGNAAVTDGSGNLYVAGSTTYKTSTDILIIKYTPAGDTLWTRKFDRNNSYDEGMSIGLDVSGNIYVGGREGSDLAVMKCSSSGNKLWNQSYNGSTNGTNQFAAFTVSPSGNATITGTMHTPQSGADISSVRFDGSGAFAWESIYSSTGNSGDGAVGCAVTSDGNLFIAGYARFDVYEEMVTIKYDQDGDTLWSRRYGASFGGNPTAIAVDARGNAYVTGRVYTAALTAASDIVTLKYSPNGVLLWAATYDNGGYDSPNAIAVDDKGNVYITGESNGSGSSDYVTLKYDSAGVQQWFAKRYNASGSSGRDQAFDLAVDNAGNVYVTGGSCATTDFYSSDIATVKYNSAGTQQWVRRYNGSATSSGGATQSYDNGVSLAVDGSGNVLVGGTVDDGGTRGGINMIVIKYNALGDTLWTARYDSPTHSIDDLHDLAVDRAGNIIMTGASIGPTEPYDYDYITVKLNASGNVQWAARYDDGNNGQESATSIVVDSAGNSYVTGSGMGKSSTLGVLFNDIVTIRYSPTGEEDWTAIYDGSGNKQDAGLGIAIDPHGTVYVAGTSAEYKGDFNDLSYDMLAIKYRQDILLAVPDGSKPATIPNVFSLSQNFPNPFNPTTAIRYQIPEASFVTLKVFDLLGREVATLVNEQKNAGSYSAQWNPNNLSSEVYLYRLQAGKYIDIKKMSFLK